MAQPLEVDGAMKWALRPFGRIVSPFFTPSTRVERLIRTQSSTEPALPCRLGMFQCEGTTRRSAPGNRSRISCPRG